jgi:rhodanese-related sulfurtransferase
MRKLSFLFPLIVTLTTSTVAIAGYDAPKEIEGATTIDVSLARELHDRGVPFVDVRNADGDEWTPGYDMGHIAGAVNLPLRGAFTEAALSEVVSKDQEVVIYCEAIDCFLTSIACKKAVGWQFEKVYYFRDGYKAWKRLAHPIE